MYNEDDIAVKNEVNLWGTHCEDQKQLKDSRTPPICTAAAFSHVPFPLKPWHHQEKKPIAIHHHDTELVVVAVDSNYLAHHQNPTAKSACLNGVKIHILGQGYKNLFDNGLGLKISLLRQFMKEIPKSDTTKVILFVDGSDVIFQANETEILSRFLESNSKILFSGEHSCFPMKFFPWNFNLGTWLGPCSGACSNSRYVCDELFPKVPEHHSSMHPIDTRNKWLNSGGFIGYASDVNKVIC